MKRRLSLRDTLLITCCALLSVIGLLPFREMPALSVDVSETVYLARAIGDGAVPYRDLFTHHFVGYVLPFVGLGTFGPLNVATIWWCAIVWNLLAALALYHLAARITGDRWSGPLAALLTVTVGWFWGWGGVTFNVQSVFLPLLIVALFLFVPSGTDLARSRHQLGSFLFGTLLCADQRLVVFFPLVLTAISCVPEQFRKRAIKDTVIFAAICPALALTVLASAGALAPFIEQTVYFPLFTRNESLITPWLKRAAALFRGGFLQEPIAVLAGVFAAIMFFRFEKRRAIGRFLAVYLTGAFLYALLGGRPFAHYLLLFGPAILLFLAVLPQSLSMFDKRVQVFGWSLVLLLTGGTALRPLFLYLDTGAVEYSGGEDSVTRTAAYVRPHLHSRSDLLVLGYVPQLYNLLDQFSPFHDLGLLSLALPDAAVRFRETIEGAVPKVLIVFRTTPAACGRPDRICPDSGIDFQDRERFGWLHELLEKRYQFPRRFESAIDEVDVYIRSDPAT